MFLDRCRVPGRGVGLRYSRLARRTKQVDSQTWAWATESSAEAIATVQICTVESEAGMVATFPAAGFQDQGRAYSRRPRKHYQMHVRVCGLSRWPSYNAKGPAAGRVLGGEVRPEESIL